MTKTSGEIPAPKPASITALKRERTRRLARLGARVYYLRKRGKEQEMYNLVCDEFLSLGGVYVKFMQGVLFSTPIMKRWHSPNRLRIFENLDYEPMDIIQILRRELSPEQLKDIALVQPQPFAAGSFGQVYLAQHKNGHRIIIKVLRPMIRELLKYDLRLLSMFSKRFAERQYDNFTIKMSEAIKDFRNATLNETDYLAEAQFASELYEAYKDHPHIVIPKTYGDLCTEHIIVQDYVGGVSGAELLRRKEQDGVDPVTYVRETLGSDLDEQLTIMGIEAITACFTLPRVQGDPHPGNIRFLPDNKVGMIDFGISAPAPGNKAAFFGIIREWHNMYGERGSLANLFEQFMRFFVNDLYRALKKISTIVPQAQGLEEQAIKFRRNNPDMMKEVGKMVQNMFEGATGAGDVQSIMNEGRLLHAFGQMVNRGNRLGLVVTLDSSEILRAAQTYMAMVETLGRRPAVLQRMLRESVARVEQQYADIVFRTDTAPSMSQAIGTVNRWLERVASRDPAMFRQLLSRIPLRSAPAASPAAVGVTTTTEETTAPEPETPSEAQATVKEETNNGSHA